MTDQLTFCLLLLFMAQYEKDNGRRWWAFLFGLLGAVCMALTMIERWVQ
jgi:hypothetical protein